MEHEIKNVSANPQEEIQLKRSLGLASLVLLGIAYMSPLCIFLYYGIISEITHGMYSLTLLITTAVMTLTAISYAKMTKVFPAAGSVYTYVERSINPHLGFVAGWAIIADYLLLPMICYLSFGLYTNALIPAAPIWAFILIGILIVTFLNCKGVQLVAFINSIITIIPILFVLTAIFFVCLYIFGGGGAGTFADFTAFYNGAEFNGNNIVMAAAILCCGFVGFDAVTTMSEEAINPQKHIGKAVILVCVGIGVIYIVMGYVLQLAWPEGWYSMETADTGALELFAAIGRPWLATAMSTINILTALACCLSGQTAVARILFGMGRDGFLPRKFFGYLHPKFQTPIKNILLTSLVELCAVFFAENLTGAVSLISFGALAGFFFVNISVVVYFYIKQKRRGISGLFHYLLLPLLGAASCLYLLFGLAGQAKLLGALWLGFGVLYLAVKTKFFKVLPPELKLD